jgi:membrane-bound lytic murein transglycosylase A
MHFVMLVPKNLDPVARGARLPVPDPRPSEKIAKLFPQTAPARDKDQKAVPASAVAAPPTETVAIAGPVPLPEPRPVIKPVREPRKPARPRRTQQQ